MIEFVAYVFAVSLFVKFLRTLADKWGVLEWAQVNAPNDLVSQLLHCPFCLSFWIGLAVCMILAIFVHWWCIFIPIFSCNLRYD